MTIKFYYGSGSPFSWTVRLVLEHKQLPYEFNWLSLKDGEHKKPEYLAINPHGKVPAIVDDGFAVWETLPIIEYLEECYSVHPVLPAGLKNRAIARRTAAEVYTYLYPVLRRLMEQTLFREDGGGDPALIAACINEADRELDYFEESLQGKYLAGTLSVADFSLYPLLALVQRLQLKQPRHDAGILIKPLLAAFMQRMEQLPYFQKTIPPHWKG